MDQVIHDFVQQGILVQQPIVAAYRAFLVAKTSGAARFVLDLSPLTPHYHTPHITLFSAAKVLATLQPNDLLFKIDFTSGFYKLNIRLEHQKFYGIYYRGVKYALTRLPMGHPLAPYVLQRVSLAVATYLHQRFSVSMISYLDDWLFFSPQLPASRICAAIENLGFTINYSKSIIVPTHVLVYLGLVINTVSQQMRPTQHCLAHMQYLLSST
jgi:hypothetical protein